MRVMARLDLSESGRKPALPEGPTDVLIFASQDHDLYAALAAIGACRLIQEGHVFTTTLHHALHVTPAHDWAMDERGEVVPA